MSILEARGAIMIQAAPIDCYNAFADSAKMTRFWFPKASGDIRKNADLEWTVGVEQDAYAIPVHIDEAVAGERIEMRWGEPGHETEITFTFAEMAGTTAVSVVERGYEGDDEVQVKHALDSTGGLNQVLVAAKVFVEHDIDINVIASRAG